MRICFPYIAQSHQILHSLPIAMEMAIAFPDIEVHVACATDENAEIVRNIAALYPEAKVVHDRLNVPWTLRLHMRFRRTTTPPKRHFLLLNRNYFSRFDALVLPESTSLFLKKIGLRRTKFIRTGHGAGDRQIVVSPAVGKFDFVLISGEKQERRLLELNLIRPGDYAFQGYPKFELVAKMAARPLRLFDNDRPTVIYNPHFDPEFSSWPLVGMDVLDFFARSTRYNLIFAPHVRLFHPPLPEKYAPFRRFMDMPNMHIDLGSVRSIDMSYTMAADIYLGDVSSQLSEFMLKPRPCLFLNPRGTNWKNDANYLSWTLGPVIPGAEELEKGIEEALASHPALLERQQQYFAYSFGSSLPFSARRGADAIVNWMRAAP